MDRNDLPLQVCRPDIPSLSARRAWIEMSKIIMSVLGLEKSLSARRAWIEIISPDIRADVYSVALRKESVDRNLVHVLEGPVCFASLSARRAWIEICYLDNIEITQAVALRKESVDRNLIHLKHS